MFRGLINDAKSAAAAVLAKYAARMTVAVPFLVAVGFATAAITLHLVDRFGAIAAYWMVAGGFTAIGLVAAVVVGVREQEEVVADAKAEKADTAEVATDTAAQAAVQLPIALLGSLLASPAGPMSALGIARLAGRNLPLIALAVIMAVLFWPSEESKAETAADDPIPTPKSNGAYASTDELGRKAA